RWRNWVRLHITGMGFSYILMLTAFYVDNGKNLPLWKELPQFAFWLLPAAVGIPLLLRTLLKHPLARRDSSRSPAPQSMDKGWAPTLRRKWPGTPTSQARWSCSQIWLPHPNSACSAPASAGRARIWRPWDAYKRRSSIFSYQIRCLRQVPDEKCYKKHRLSDDL